MGVRRDGNPGVGGEVSWVPGGWHGHRSQSPPSLEFIQLAVNPRHHRPREGAVWGRVQGLPCQGRVGLVRSEGVHRAPGVTGSGVEDRAGFDREIPCRGLPFGAGQHGALVAPVPEPVRGVQDRACRGCAAKMGAGGNMFEAQALEDVLL